MDLTEENKPLFESLMALIRSSSTLNAQDVSFIRSLNRDFNKRSTNASKQLLSIINKLVKSCQPPNGTHEDFTSADDLIERYTSIEQTIDLLLDKMKARPKAQAPAVAAAASTSALQDKQVKEYMRLANNIAKPQLKFATKVDNSVGPFKPLLTKKPHGLVSLSQSMEVQQPDETHKNEWYEQPYLQEIMTSKCKVRSGSNEFPEWDKTPLTFVDNTESLFKMVNKLKKTKIIAVDVEHHDYRSYLGLVCLLQISAGGEDYIVDALSLRSELQILNTVFANPKIVKVLHGAKMDIMWLQRDLGVYIVNLFDTYFAARELGFPKLSLAYLLQKYANFDAQKKYQLADWRLRPLPQELMDYARADTHFLLYIYHQLHKSLVEENKLDIVLNESRKVASQRYEKPGWNLQEPEWVNFSIKHRIQGKLGRAVMVKLWEWRDKKAREYDESPRFVLSPPSIANLCVSKPRNGMEVLNGIQRPSHIVQTCADEIAKVVQNACKNADKIDTTIPERIPVAANPIYSKNINVSEMRADSTFLISPPNETFTQPHICLDVVEPRNLEIAQKINEEAEEAQREQERQTEIEREAKRTLSQRVAEEEALKAAQREATDRATGKGGKTINVVSDDEDIKITINPSKKRATKKKVSEDAFDFKSAPEVMNSTEEAVRSFMHQFSDNNPKKNRKRPAKQARSVR